MKQICAFAQECSQQFLAWFIRENALSEFSSWSYTDTNKFEPEIQYKFEVKRGSPLGLGGITQWVTVLNPGRQLWIGYRNEKKILVVGPKSKSEKVPIAIKKWLADLASECDEP